MRNLAIKKQNTPSALVKPHFVPFFVFYITSRLSFTLENHWRIIFFSQLFKEKISLLPSSRVQGQVCTTQRNTRQLRPWLQMETASRDHFMPGLSLDRAVTLSPQLPRSIGVEPVQVLCVHWSLSQHLSALSWCYLWHVTCLSNVSMALEVMPQYPVSYIKIQTHTAMFLLPM